MQGGLDVNPVVDGVMRPPLHSSPLLIPLSTLSPARRDHTRPGPHCPHYLLGGDLPTPNYGRIHFPTQFTVPQPFTTVLVAQVCPRCVQIILHALCVLVSPRTYYVALLILFFAQNFQ